tara:strand:- start:11927 stop:13375 length:1449 start_codon:yes stop_codon:yes gene_type:complete
MSSRLKSKTLSGIFWAFFDAIGLQAIQFIIVIILARILSPAEFGIIAMLTIFTSIAYSLIDSGFSTAIIQKKNATIIDETSVFYFNIFIGLLTTLILWITAPWIASFYNEPELTFLTRVLSITLFIDSVGIMHYTLMKKSIDFKKLTKISVIASVFSGIVGIGMAYNNFGVWSLVGYTISNKLFRLILYWTLNTWRPILVFSISSLRSMFNYGSNIVFIGLMDTFFNHIYLLVIGKFFSASDLGYYSRAKSLQQALVQNISGIVSRVTFSVFSEIQDDKKRLKRVSKKIISSVALLTFPTIMGLYVVSKPLIVVLLSSKWLASVPYLQLLCGLGLTVPLNTINLNVLKAIGLSGLLFRLELFKKVLIVIAILLTYQSGIKTMIIGQVVVYSLSYLLNIYFTSKFISYNFFEQIIDIFPSFILAVIMAYCIHLFTFIQINNQFLLLIIQVTAAIILYISLCIIFKISSFFELYNIVKNKIQKI